MSEVTALSLVELSRKLEAGDLSTREVAEAHLARIAELNESSKAFIAVCAERALAQAENAGSRAPLFGVPYAVKDMIDVAGLATTGGSPAGAEEIAEADADVVDRLESHGAILLGKNNLHEYAYGATGENDLYGTPPNPHDPSRIAGGSSSGSAAAVARRMVSFALGTDTGGSIRAPAAICGLVGLKPSFGRVSTAGVMPFAWSLDHVGTFTRDVTDARVLFALLTSGAEDARGLRDEPARPPDGSLDTLRIGVCHTLIEETCAPAVGEAVATAVARLESAGARLANVDFPDISVARSVCLTVQLAESIAYHRPRLETHGHLYSQAFRAGLAFGQFLLAEHYVNAQRMMVKYRQEMAERMAGLDVLLTPGSPVLAPRLGESFVTIRGERVATGNALTRFTSLFNLTGQPALTLPIGRHENRLPVSIQLVGHRGRDEALLEAAQAIEAALR